MRTRAVLLAVLLTGCTASEAAVPSVVQVARSSVEPTRGPIPDIVDLRLPVSPMPSRVVVAQPTPRLVVVERQPTAKPASGHREVGGRASWYDDGPGLYAAAGPALRVGDWRGRIVTVSAGGRTARVRLSDWCQCYWKQPNERIIDLSPDAFRQLAPLGRGIVKVTVSW